MNARILESNKVVPGGVPVDITGAGMTGDYVSFKTHRRCLVVISQGAWAGGTPAVTLRQAQDNADAGGKPLGFTEYWQGTALTDDVLARTAVSGNTFNLPAAANTFTLIEVHESDLDTDNDFTHFRAAVASPGANADLLAITYFFGDPKESGSPVTMPSAIS